MSEDKAQYTSLIRQLVPFNDLSEHLQDEAMIIANVNKFKKKQFVFKQGDKDNFSFYILNGEIELLANKTLHSTIVGGTDRARYALAQLQPRQFSAKTKTEAVILQMDRAALDRLMVMEDKDDADDTITGDSQMEVSDLDSEDSGDWMTSMLQSELFSQLPMANIQQLFALLEPVEFTAGDSVIKQGESGEHYYIIQEGRCEVTRAPSSGSDPIKLAELKVGDSFGEEALLTDAKRNASINMLTDGILMQLSKDNFINLIKKPALSALKYQDALKEVENGAVWLDVRFKNEYEDMNIEGSINIPLNVLRMQTEKLESDKTYIVYCDTGGRSSAAAFLLAQRGFNVSYLNKGMMSVPELAEKEKPKKEEEPAKEKPVEAKKKPEKVQEEKADDSSEMEPAVRASVLTADIAKKDAELKETKEHPVAKDNKEDLKKQKADQDRLEKERKQLEAEKLAAEKAAKKKSDEETAKINKLKADAEKRLQAEKKKLEDVYNRNAKEMEKLQQMKKEAEEQIKKEREKLQKEAAEAQAKLEKAAAEKKVQQEEMEKQLQEKAKAKLEQERRKLAEEMSKTSDVLEQAKREKAAADAARKAAEEEAQKIVSEYKKQVDKERESEDARLKEERKKLEEESKKIQDAVKEIQSAKQDAETARKLAEEQASKLKEQQQQESKTQDNDSKAALDNEIKEAEAKLAEARKNVESAQQAEHTIEEAREVNEEELRRQKEIEEEMRSVTAADLEEFMKEHEEQEKAKPKVVDTVDHAKRIKERADAAKQDAEKATDDLFADIASQLDS